MHYEFDPLLRQRAPPTPKPPQPPLGDIVRLAQWQAEQKYRRLPKPALALATTLVTFPLLSAIDARLADPASHLYRQLIEIGQTMHAHMDEPSTVLVRNIVSFAAKELDGLLLTFDHRNGPTAIVAAEMLNNLLGELAITGSIWSALSNRGMSYDERLEKGKVPVPRRFPIQSVIIGDPEVAENYQIARARKGKPTYGAVYINPVPYGRRKIPWCSYGYANKPTDMDLPSPNYRRTMADFSGLSRTQTLVVLSQQPGHELFPDQGNFAVRPTEVITLIEDMEKVRPGHWNHREIRMSSPTQEYTGISEADPTRATMRLAQTHGARTQDISPEQVFVREIQGIVSVRTRFRDAEGTTGLIAICPVGGVESGEIERMRDALSTNTLEDPIQYEVDIVGPTETELEGHDIVLVHGKRDDDVTSSALDMGMEIPKVRAQLLPVVRSVYSAYRFAKEEIPAFDISQAMMGEE